MKRKTWLIDIGNSQVEWCELKESGEFSTCHCIDTKTLSEHVIRDVFDGGYCVVSSVVPSKDTLFDTIHTIDVHRVTHQTLPELRINVDHPEEVGADRLVNAVAAYKMHGGPCVVIDSGTALTFCYVDASGVYQGGMIFPGMRICSQSLYEKTAKIPLIWVKEQDGLYGKSTKQAVEYGLYQGFLGILHQWIALYRKEVPGITVIGTGHGLELFKEHIQLDVYEKQLIFHGLRACMPIIQE